MRYQGGKVLISKPLSQKILELLQIKNINPKTTTLVSLFCGACAVETKLADHFKKVICNDQHKYIIALLKKVQDGWQIPDYISPEKYKYVRENKDEDKALTGFVGFGCSFAGKWFGGYARSAGKKYAREAKNSLTRDKKHWDNIDFICKDYKDVDIPKNSVIYADPPYAGTSKYRGTEFNSNEFWSYIEKISKKHLVFISEQNAPEDFVCIWSKQKRRTISKDDNKSLVTEKLFIHKIWA